MGLVQLFIVGILFSGSLVGYCVTLPRSIAINMRLWFTLPLLLLSIFIFALLGYLRVGAWSILALGWLLLLVKFIRYQNTELGFSRIGFSSASIAVLILFVLTLLYLLSAGVGSSDDYAYWASLSKYLYFHHQLPGHQSGLLLTHLTYTPGLACWHYFCYALSTHFDLRLAYLSQFFWLLALLMLVMQRNLQITLMYWSLIILVLTLVFGSFMAKLQADVWLAILLFGVLWVYVQSSALLLRWVLLLPALMVMYLFKQAGLMMSVGLTVLLLISSLFAETATRREKRGACLLAAIAVVVVVMLKFLWVRHWHQAGFVAFDSPVSWSSLKALLDVTNPLTRVHINAVARGVVLGGADELRTPFAVWYGILAVLWWRIIKGSVGDQRRRYVAVLIGLIVMYFLYVLGFYVLESTIFNVGVGKFQHVLAVRRYLGIVFAPIITLTICLFVKQCLADRPVFRWRWPIGMMTLVIAVVVLSIPQRLKRQHSQQTPAMQLSDRIQSTLSNSKPLKVCVTGGEENIKFVYYLMPNHVNMYELPTAACKLFRQAVLGCQRLYIYKQNPKAWRCLHKLGAHKVEKGSYYRVNANSDRPLEWLKTLRYD